MKPYCHDCRKPVRSLIEHRTTAVHRAATTSVRSTAPRGSQPYRAPYTLPAPDAAYDAWLEKKHQAAAPPTIDDLFPVEVCDPLPERHAERGYMPEPCGKCGKAFKTPAGAKWHATNNSDCERWQRKERAA